MSEELERLRRLAAQAIENRDVLRRKRRYAEAIKQENAALTLSARANALQKGGRP